MIAVWASTAERDRWAAMEYIANDNPEVALKLDEEISLAVRRLEQYPYSTRIGRLKGTREAIIGSYILVYEVHPDCLLITHFVHCARLFPRDPQ